MVGDHLAVEDELVISDRLRHENAFDASRNGTRHGAVGVNEQRL